MQGHGKLGAPDRAGLLLLCSRSHRPLQLSRSHKPLLLSLHKTLTQAQRMHTPGNRMLTPIRCQSTQTCIRHQTLLMVQSSRTQAQQNPGSAATDQPSRRARLHSAWQAQRPAVLAAVIASRRPPQAGSRCQTPGCEGMAAVRCLTCLGQSLLCNSCDLAAHPHHHLHQQQAIMGECCLPILADTFHHPAHSEYTEGEFTLSYVFCSCLMGLSCRVMLLAD